MQFNNPLITNSSGRVSPIQGVSLTVKLWKSSNSATEMFLPFAVTRVQGGDPVNVKKAILLLSAAQQVILDEVDPILSTFPLLNQLYFYNFQPFYFAFKKENYGSDDYLFDLGAYSCIVIVTEDTYVINF